MHTPYAVTASLLVALIMSGSISHGSKLREDSRFARSTSGHAQAVVRVPRGPAVVIDGHLAPGEWVGSYEQTLPGGVQLYMRHDDEYLYVGLQVAPKGYPSICVTTGDTVRLLHASAALGTVVYTRDGASWQRRTRIEWTMRSGDTTGVGKAAQRAFLNSERWVGSNEAMSNVDREMKISLALMNRADLRMAIGVYTETEDRVLAWPSGLSDPCTAALTVKGPIPEAMMTDPTRWARLSLVP